MEIQNIQNRIQYSTLEGYQNENNNWRSRSFDADNGDVSK